MSAPRQTVIDSHAGGRYYAQILSCQVILQSYQGAGVAQLVEQRFRKPQVARSIRVAGSTVFHEILGSCGISPVRGFDAETHSATTSYRWKTWVQ